jgi:hypothetical protein
MIYYCLQLTLSGFVDVCQNYLININEERTMRTKIWASGLIVALTIGSPLSNHQAHAEELWPLDLPSVLVGIPAGVLPPPGVYGQLDNYFAQFYNYNGMGNKATNGAVDALIEIPSVLWVPGIKILGANYAAAVAIPFTYNSYQTLQHATPGPGNLGLFNTLIVPVMLSWMLPEHFLVRASTNFFLDDASSTMTALVKGDLKNGGLPSGNSFSTFMPSIGVSWLNNGWNISADFRFGVPLGSTSAPNYHYRTGDVFLADYTIAKTFDSWTIGFGASQMNQVQKDTFNGQSVPGSVYRNYSVGPVIGYQLKGGIQITALWAHSVMTTGGVGGDAFDLRLSTRF